MEVVVTAGAKSRAKL